MYPQIFVIGYLDYSTYFPSSSIPFFLIICKAFSSFQPIYMYIL